MGIFDRIAGWSNKSDVERMSVDRRLFLKGLTVSSAGLVLPVSTFVDFGKGGDRERWCIDLGRKFITPASMDCYGSEDLFLVDFESQLFERDHGVSVEELTRNLPRDHLGGGFGNMRLDSLRGAIGSYHNGDLKVFSPTDLRDVSPRRVSSEGDLDKLGFIRYDFEESDSDLRKYGDLDSSGFHLRPYNVP